MFEIGVSQQEGSLRGLVALYFPFINTFFVRASLSPHLSSNLMVQPDKAALTVRRCQEVIRRVAGQLVQEKKHKIAEAERSGSIYQGKDLLTLLCMPWFPFFFFLSLMDSHSEVERCSRSCSGTTHIRRRHPPQHQHLHVRRLRHKLTRDHLDALPPRQVPPPSRPAFVTSS